MNFSGFKPVPIDRCCGLVENDDPTKLPLGVAAVCKNSRFLSESVATRYGLERTMVTGQGGAITGLSMLKYTGAVPVKIPIIFDTSGDMWYESPPGSGTLVPVVTTLLGAGMNQQIALAYDNAYIGIGDLVTGKLKPVVFAGGTKILDKLSMLPVGQPWEAGRKYAVGEMVSPQTANAHLYRCQVAGTSGNAQPAFPTGTGLTIGDNGITWKETTPAGVQSGTVGNVCTGIRFMIVLFKNRNGYISGCSDAVPVSITIGADGFRVDVSVIPVGPANTAARICAFTVAGDSSAGNYFYCPFDDNDGGIPITATIINDNVTTAATFNFTDIFLQDAEDVTHAFDRIEVPEAGDIYFSKALNQLVFTQVNGFPSGHLLSDESDPEGVELPDNEIEVAQKDGDRTVCWREFRITQLSLKENGAYAITPQGDTPNTWNAAEAWRGSGPCGPRAIAITNDFVMYAHKTGAWKWAGGAPARINNEVMFKTWARINWNAKQTIWILIDEDASEVLFGLPLDGATTPNHVLRLNYFMGWEDPIVFSIRMGKLIPNVNGRKWSVDDIPANLAFIAERDLVTPVDARINNRQILFAGQDGIVRMQVPDVYHDDNADGTPAGINWQYQPVYAPNPGVNIMELGGATWSAKGNGLVNVSAVYEKEVNGSLSKLLTNDRRQCYLTAEELEFDAGCTGVQNEYIALKFDNGAIPDSWGELHKADMQMRVKWAQRKS